MPDQPVPTAIGLSVQQGVAELGLTIDMSIKPVWGEITAQGPDEDKPYHHEWKQVRQHPDDKWRQILSSASTDTVAGAYGSIIKPEAEGLPEVLLNPAVEINQRPVRAGTIVWLVPTRLMIDEHGNMHRFWLCEFKQLRAFQLTQTHIATGVIANEDTQLEASAIRPRPMVSAPRATTLGCQWLDDLSESGTLYASHRAGNPSGDHYFRFGIALGQDYVLQAVPYFGARGWAEYVPHATIIDYDEDGPVWRGEWQIVSINSMEITQVVILETIMPNELGEVSLQSRDEDPIPFQPSKIWVWNNLPVELTIGSLHNVYFDKYLWVWIPVTPLATQHGLSLYASGTVDSVDEAWNVVPLDNPIGGSEYGVNLVHVGNQLVNRGPLAAIGRASWSVTAQRVIGTVGANDISSRLEIALFNNGAHVVGTSSEITSSRRETTGEGRNAVNHAGGSVNQTVAAGAGLDVRIRMQNSDGAWDTWRTVPAMCRLTFSTVSTTYLKS